MNRFINIRSCLFTSLILLMTSGLSVNAQVYSGPVNYVRTWDPVKPETNVNNITTAATPSTFRMTTQYIDGLGRPMQTVIKHGSRAAGYPATDLVDQVTYDEFGRERYKYLPFPSSGGTAAQSDGSFKPNPYSQQPYSLGNIYLLSPLKDQNETNLYAQTNFEASPLNRVTETFAPGGNWAGTASQPLEANRHSVKIKYYTNTANDLVRIWNITNAANVGDWGTITTPSGNDGYYQPGTLFKTITVDEHNKQVIEFKDKQGQIILKKVQLNASSDDGSGAGYADWLCTYYIYDDLGNLRDVLQPNCVNGIYTSWVIPQNNLEQSVFRYEYDARNRVIRKKVPGAADVYMIYDARDRLVLTQDGNLRVNKQWIFTKYDALNRPVMTGLYTNTVYLTLAAMQGYLNTQALGFAETRNSSGFPYTLNQSFPVITDSRNVYTVSCYDSYFGVPVGLEPTFNNSWTTGFYTTFNSAPLYAQPQTATTQTTGLVTWTQTKVLGSDNTYLTTVNTYDEKNRPIQVKQTNLAGGTDISISQYNWVGQVLITAVKTQVGAVEITQQTRMSYDELGRLIKVEKNQRHSGLNGNSFSAWTTTLTNEYDVLGQLKKKTIGSKKDAGNNYINPRVPLQEMEYDYNVRGWMLGLNRDYIATAGQATDKLFGFELGYDKQTNKAGNSFDAAQFNGNITGMLWKSDGDDVRRKYDFSYDAANRLLKAEFKQDQSSTGWGKDLVDFSVQMGNNGGNDNTAYDANGNIIKMKQWGIDIAGPRQIDDLLYTYYGNYLKKVTESTVIGSSDYKLGDFTDKNRTGDDYGYDLAGNMVSDLNKGLVGGVSINMGSGGAISYNHLNLPVEINVKADDGTTNKGRITYTYDASGAKLKKTTEEYAITANNNTATTTVTTYIGGLVLESKTVNGTSLYTDKLQFAGQEEGRMRAKYENAINPHTITGLEYDYFIKDHLGNVRMVLTEEQKTIYYPAATLEGTYSASNPQAGSMVNFEKQFYKIDPNKIVNEPWTGETSANTLLYYNNNGNPPSNLSYPSGTTPVQTDNSSKMYKLNATSNKTGLDFVIKVMAGDKIDIFGKSYYQNTGTINNGNSTALDLLSIFTSLLGAPGNDMAGKGMTASGLNGLNSGLLPSSFIRGANGETTTIPKAYINYIFFDEQFRYAGGWGSRAGGSGIVTDHWANDGNLRDITVPKNGYLYVYVTNESNVDVFFDNLQVIHKPGMILEETHYYPFGLTMAGISSKALQFGGPENKRMFNGGNELQSKEFSDGSGLDMYDAVYRLYDAQIGRFHQIDPLADFSLRWSPYVFSSNNPILRNDPLGLRDTIVNGEKGETKTLPNVTVRGTFKRYTKGQHEDESAAGRFWRMHARHTTGVTPQVSNLFELGANSMLRTRMVWLVGDMVDRVNKDPAMKAYQAKLVALIKADPRFGKMKFAWIGDQENLEFGGQRAKGEDWKGLSNENPLLHLATWKVAADPLTWTLRHANVQSDAIIKEDGTIVFYHYLNDKLDLRPGPGHTEAYNQVTSVVGPLYHDVFRGSDNMQVRANWSTTVNK